MDSAKKYPGSWDSIMLFTPVDFNDPPQESEAKLQKFAEDVRIAKEQGLSAFISNAANPTRSPSGKLLCTLALAVPKASLAHRSGCAAKK